MARSYSWLLACGISIVLIAGAKAQERSAPPRSIHPRRSQAPAHLSAEAKKVLSLSREQFSAKYIEKMGDYHLRNEPGLRSELEKIGNVPCYWVTGPKGKYRDDAVIVYFHGGAYSFGDAKEAAGCFLPVYEELGIKGVSVQYRLAPDHPFPAALDDATRVYKALLDRFNSKRIVFMGDSAGGGLALAATLKLRREKVPLPAALVLIGAWVNLSPDESDSAITLADWDTWQDIADDEETVPAYAGDNTTFTQKQDQQLNPILGHVIKRPCLRHSLSVTRMGL